MSTKVHLVLVGGRVVHDVNSGVVFICGRGVDNIVDSALICSGVSNSASSAHVDTVVVVAGISVVSKPDVGSAASVERCCHYY